MEIKLEIAELRKTMTLQQIAAALNVDRSTVVRAQRGKGVSAYTYVLAHDLLKKVRRKRSKTKGCQ